MDEFIQIEVNWKDINIKKEDILSNIGISSDKLTNSDFSNIIDYILQRITICYPLPSFCLSFVDGQTKESDHLILTSLNTSVIFNIGKIIYNQLKDSESYIIFVATAGIGFDFFLQKIKKEDDIVKIYIADIIGSIIAEKCADAVERKLETLLCEGFNHTNRFSPGYCEWNVNEQKKLFSLFPINNPCNIMLTSSNLMLPVKSVSGIIGIGKKVRKLEYSCGLCNLKNCYKMKLKV